MDFLNDKEKAEVEKFAFNATMREAVKKVVLDIVYKGTLLKGKDAEPTKNFTLSLASQAGKMNITNEQVGAELRSMWAGVDLLESGFEAIMDMVKKPEPKKDKMNPAR